MGERKRALCVGILAHVDAGKTTLSEAMLYLSGAVRKLGRVDFAAAVDCRIRVRYHKNQKGCE